MQKKDSIMLSIKVALLTLKEESSSSVSFYSILLFCLISINTLTRALHKL